MLSRVFRSTAPATVRTLIWTTPRVTPILSSSHSNRSFSKKSEVVHSANAPAAIGPYSQGVKANGFLFVSGSLGLDPKTGDFPSKTDVVIQTKQSLDNIGAILKAGNSSFGQVVKTTILLADMADFPKVNETYATYFSGSFPARATYSVKGLPKGALVEIEAIATHN